MHERVPCTLDPHLSCTPECPVFQTARVEQCVKEDMHPELSPDDICELTALMFTRCEPIDRGFMLLNSAIVLENTCGASLDECIRLNQEIVEENQQRP